MPHHRVMRVVRPVTYTEPTTELSTPRCAAAGPAILSCHGRRRWYKSRADHNGDNRRVYM